MKTRVLLLLLILAGWAGPVVADTMPPARVALFQGDRTAALSFTFDDGWEDAASLGAPLLEKYNMRGTFFIVPGLLSEEDPPPGKNNYGKVPWKRWREIAETGHEIGNHSLEHAMNFTDADDDKLWRQIVAAHDLIRARIGTAPISFALPSSNTLNDWTVKVIDSCHLFTRRKITGYGGKNCTVESANALVDRAIKDGIHMTTLFHAVENGYDAFSSAAVLDGHLAYVNTVRDRIWVDTFGNVCAYTAEREAAKLELAPVENGVSISLTTPGLDPQKFHAPLTVVIEKKGASMAQASRTGEEFSLPLVVKDDRILVEIVPGPEPVKLVWQNGAKP